MVEFRVTVERKQRALIEVEAESIDEAIVQAMASIERQGEAAELWQDVFRLYDISVEVILPAHLVPDNYTEVVADLCDICGSPTVMGVNDIYLEGFVPDLVCEKCFAANRDDVRTRWEAREDVNRHRV